MQTNMAITTGETCGKKLNEDGFSGSNFSKVVGNKAAAKTKMTPMKIVSMEQAAARIQKPANAGLAGNSASSRTAGGASGIWTFCGTYTGPIWPTLTGVSHCGQTLAPSGTSAPHFSQLTIAALQGEPQET
jgi:hypothetical protein